jgi:DNA mismatch repair protein MutL
MAVQRYATSKIHTVDDLFHLKTYGFRGEALSSIAEVSHFELLTRKSESESGFSYSKKDAKWVEQEIGMPLGTSITISHLFYNVPARRKFLKTSFTEYQHILSVLTDFALLNFNCGFVFTHNAAQIFSYRKKSQWRDRISDVLGSTLAQHMIAVEASTEHMRLTGYIVPPEQVVQNKKHQYVFINDRPVRDYLVLKAIHDAYRDRVPKDRFPATVLKLDIDPELVDVNVHPRKMEVKFSDTNAVFSFVVESIRNALSTQADTKFITSVPETTFGASPAQRVYTLGGGAQARVSLRTSSTQVKQSLELYKKVLDVQKFTHLSLEQQLSQWTILGQVAKKYILATLNESLYIFDQHAASEGVLYAKLTREEKQVSRQKLLVPLTLNLPRHTYDVLIAQTEVLSELGFSIDDFGKNTIVIRELPSDVSGFDLTNLIMGIAADMENDGEYTKLATLEEKKVRIMRYTACRSAVKFGDALSRIELDQLLKEVETCGVTSCAHGRPIVWEIPFSEMNKKFFRC